MIQSFFFVSGESRMELAWKLVGQKVSKAKSEILVEYKKKSRKPPLGKFRGYPYTSTYKYLRCMVTNTLCVRKHIEFLN